MLFVEYLYSSELKKQLVKTNLNGSFHTQVSNLPSPRISHAARKVAIGDTYFKTIFMDSPTRDCSCGKCLGDRTASSLLHNFRWTEAPFEEILGTNGCTQAANTERAFAASGASVERISG